MISASPDCRLFDEESGSSFGPEFDSVAEVLEFITWYRDDVLTDGIGWVDESEAPPADLRLLSADELVSLKWIWDVNKEAWLAAQARFAAAQSSSAR